MSKSLDLNCAFVVLCFFAVEPQELGEREKLIFILVFSYLVLHILNIMGHIFMKFAVDIYGPQRIIHWPHDIYSIVYSRSKVKTKILFKACHYFYQQCSTFIFPEVRCFPCCALSFLKTDYEQCSQGGNIYQREKLHFFLRLNSLNTCYQGDTCLQFEWRHNLFISKVTSRA